MFFIRVFLIAWTVLFIGCNDQRNDTIKPYNSSSSLAVIDKKKIQRRANKQSFYQRPDFEKGSKKWDKALSSRAEELALDWSSKIPNRLMSKLSETDKLELATRLFNLARLEIQYYWKDVQKLEYKADRTAELNSIKWMLKTEKQFKFYLL